MALVAWKDQNNNNVVDQNGASILFKKTIVQILPKLTITASATVVKPLGTVSVNMALAVNSQVTRPVSMSCKVGMLLTVNSGISDKINNWDTIMFKYIGDRTIG